MPDLLREVTSYGDGGGRMYSDEELLFKAGSVAEHAWSAMRMVDYKLRPAIWESVVVTGNASKVKGTAISIPLRLICANTSSVGVSTALVHSLSNFLIDPTSGSDSQPKLIKLMKQPDYFSEFKDKPDLSGFLGATITAKMAFVDSVRSSSRLRKV